MSDLKFNDLILIARGAIKSYFENQKLMPKNDLRKKYSEKKACFVTLTINNRLRGCIGSLTPIKPLWMDVVDNAINAAFNDYRFKPLSKKEFEKIKIEVSVLSNAKEIKYNNSNDLLNKIKKNYGLILSKNSFSSTFLPQVWEQINTKKEFLEELSLKAGLKKDDWKTSKIFYYTVTSQKEE